MPQKSSKYTSAVAWDSESPSKRCRVSSTVNTTVRPELCHIASSTSAVHVAPAELSVEVTGSERTLTAARLASGFAEELDDDELS